MLVVAYYVENCGGRCLVEGREKRRTAEATGGKGRQWMVVVQEKEVLKLRGASSPVNKP